jgi:hypothetical protein
VSYSGTPRSETKSPLTDHQLQSGGYGLGAVRTCRLSGGGELLDRHVFTGREATVKVCGVTVAMPQG